MSSQRFTPEFKDKTRDLVRAYIFDYIEVFYNRTRRHSHLGGVSPEVFEMASAWGSDLSVRPGKSHYALVQH